VLCFHPSITNASFDVIEEDQSPSSTGFFSHLLSRFGKGTSTTHQHPLRHGDKPQKPILPPDGREPITSDFIPSRIYSMQSSWYAAVMQKYGLPLDSRHLYTKSDWEFEAAAVASKKVRSDILQRVAQWLNETVTDRPFTDLYNTEGRGEFPGPNFFARPVVGGHFAFLTLERACGGKAKEGLAFLDAEEGEGRVEL
jgi:hypothetical protein